MTDSEKEKLFQKHSQRVQEQVDAIVKQKERIRKQEEADRAFSEKVAKAGGWGGMASGQKMRLLETSLWKMQDDLIDKVEQAERDLVDMDYIRKIWKIIDKAKNSTSVRSCNSVVAKALNSKVAMNADVDFSRKVKVRAVSATVLGPKEETKVITLGQLRDNFAQSGHSRLFPMVLKDIEAGRIANPNYETPCDVWVQWA